MVWYLLNVTKKACVQSFEKGFSPAKDGAKHIKDDDVYIYTKGDLDSQIFECTGAGKRKCMELQGLTIKLKTRSLKLTNDLLHRMILTPIKKNVYDWKCDHPTAKGDCEISVPKKGDLCTKHKNVKRVFPVTYEIYHDSTPNISFVGTYSTLAKARKAALNYAVELMKLGLRWEVGSNEEGDSLEGYRNLDLQEYVEIYQQDIQ